MKLIKKRVPLSDDDEIVLNPNYRAIKVDPNEVYITHGLRSVYSYVVMDDRKLGVLGKIIDMLKQPISVQELLSKLKLSADDTQYIKNFINDLYEMGIISKANENTVTAYYRVHYEDVPDLTTKDLCIIGSGPLGIRIISTLLALGFRSINVFDDRIFLDSKVEKSQFPLYIKRYLSSCRNYSDIVKNFIKDYEEYKTHVKIHDAINEDSLVDVAKSSEITVVTAEYYRPKLFNDLNELAHRNEFRLLYGFIDGSIGVVGPLVIPKETACYMCFENAFEACMHHREDFITLKHQMMLHESEQAYYISQVTPLYDILSGFIIDNLIRFLIGDALPLLNRVLFLNFESLEIEIQDFLKNPRCPVCSSLKPAHRSPMEL
jgi:thiazole/oxazole-forming peptide maturase SagC family component